MIRRVCADLAAWLHAARPLTVCPARPAPAAFVCRPPQAFLHATSCGGFLVGWLYDFSRVGWYTMVRCRFRHATAIWPPLYRRSFRCHEVAIAGFAVTRLLLLIPLLSAGCAYTYYFGGCRRRTDLRPGWSTRPCTPVLWVVNQVRSWSLR